MQQLDEADKCYNEALSIDPGLARVWIEKARIAYRRGLLHDSVKYCDNALSINPESVRAMNNKAGALLELGQTDAAIGLAQKAVERRPDYIQAWACLSKAYAKKGDHRRAREYDERVQTLLQTGGAVFEGFE